MTLVRPAVLLPLLVACTPASPREPGSPPAAPTRAGEAPGRRVARVRRPATDDHRGSVRHHRPAFGRASRRGPMGRAVDRLAATGRSLRPGRGARAYRGHRSARLRPDGAVGSNRVLGCAGPAGRATRRRARHGQRRTHRGSCRLRVGRQQPVPSTPPDGARAGVTTTAGSSATAPARHAASIAHLDRTSLDVRTSARGMPAPVRCRGTLAKPAVRSESAPTRSGPMAKNPTTETDPPHWGGTPCQETKAPPAKFEEGLPTVDAVTDLWPDDF